MNSSKPHPVNDAGTSVELLNIQPSDSFENASTSLSRNGYNQHRYPSKRKKKRIFWQKCQPFPWRIFSVISSLPVALAPIVVLATVAEEASVGYILGRDCYPNGLWKEADGATWRIMDSSYFFTPNLSFGAMTFTQVKVIDIAWDLCIGRGGQMLLAYVNYRVFNEWLLYHMEMHLTSYKMYTAIAFQTTTLGTLGVLGREFLAFGKGTWRRFFRWLAVLCILVSTLYVLTFPTLMAAMTGYITTYQAYIEDNTRNLIDFDKATGVRYIIWDNDRIENYSSPIVVTIADEDLLQAVRNYTTKYADTPWNPNLPSIVTNSPPQTTTFFTNKTSTFVWNNLTVELPAPTLNITITSEGSWPGTISPGLEYAYYSLTPILPAARQSAFYTAQYVHEHGSCKPSETYQWGFSYIFLFMVSIFNFVWSFITVGMWWDTVRESRMYRAGRRPGLLRSILDLSKAIREELSELDENEIEEMCEEDIKRVIRASGGKLVVPREEVRIGRTTESEDEGGGNGRKRSWKRSLMKGSSF